MPAAVLRRVLALAAVGALVAACDPPACPPGSHDEMGRCVADSDAAIDAGPVDAFVLGDAPGQDAFVAPIDAPPDACALMDLFEDRDLDGHGDAMRPIRACAVTMGVAGSSDDCDDDAATTHPGASELCNGEDDDCDQGVDESLQGLVGTPAMLESDSLEAMHAVAVASSYVVAFDAFTGMGTRGIWSRRYDADGVAVAVPSLAVPLNPPPLLRIVPYSPTHAVLWFSSGDADPRELRGGIFDVAAGTVGPLMLGPIASAASASFAAAADHVAVYVQPGGQVVGARFDRDTLMPLGAPVPLPLLRDRTRGVHPHPSGALLLETLDASTLSVAVLGRTDFAELSRVELPVSGSFAHLSTMDPDGRVAVLATGAETFAILRFHVDDLGAAPVPVTAIDFTVEQPLGSAPPSMVASRAGTDFVVSVLTGGGGGLSWSHADPSGGRGTTTLVETGAPVLLIAAARLSSRRGAIFYVIDTGAGGRALMMQRIGCE